MNINFLRNNYDLGENKKENTMNLKCIIGLHAWRGCKCSVCGKTRDQEHDWSKDCGKCSACGKTRVGDHQWRRCLCLKCGTSKADPVVKLIDEFRQKVVSREINREEGRCWDIQMCYQRFSRAGGAYELLKTAFNGVLYISNFFDQAVVANILKYTESVQELLLWHTFDSKELDNLKNQLQSPDAVPDVLDQVYAKSRQRM